MHFFKFRNFFKMSGYTVEECYVKILLSSEEKSAFSSEMCFLFIPCPVPVLFFCLFVFKSQAQKPLILSSSQFIKWESRFCVWTSSA